jgi:hypothetical protein
MSLMCSPAIRISTRAYANFPCWIYTADPLDYCGIACLVKGRGPNMYTRLNFDSSLYWLIPLQYHVLQSWSTHSRFLSASPSTCTGNCEVEASGQRKKRSGSEHDHRLGLAKIDHSASKKNPGGMSAGTQRKSATLLTKTCLWPGWVYPPEREGTLNSLVYTSARRREDLLDVTKIRMLIRAAGMID